MSMSIWLGAVAMSGIVAAIVFPLMRQLEPTLGAYPSYEGDHALLSAGRVASKVFFTVDTIQFVCASITLACMIVMLITGYKINTIARFFRILVLSMTLAILSYHLFLFMPNLTMTLQGYWEFAAQGESARADQFKDRFLESHSAASRLLGTLTIAVLINIILAGWTLTSTKPEPSTETQPND